MSVAVLSSGSSLRTAVVDAVRRFSLDMSGFISLLVDFDLSGEWAFDNVSSCAHWVAERTDTEVCTVREWLRVGHALSVLDEIARRFDDGRLSYSKVRALTRVANADNQHELCAIAARVPAADLAAALARWLTDNENADDLAERHRAATRLSWHLDADGMVVGSFRYPPEVAAVLKTAINAQLLRAQRGKRASAGDRSSRSVTKWPSLGQQRADALIGLILGGGTKVVTEVVIHIRGDGCAFDDGTPVANSLAARIASEAFLRVLIHDANGRPINASRRQRRPTTRQKRVVRERDRACVDCGSTDLIQYDHNPAWDETHHTVVDELEARCAPCHHKRHAAEGG
ncbi:MAG TPA: hypothetical protein VM282_22755 [Acidimicrobiales bacterium]|nr:hypothetical protein [Acidimicrobiales bacterium]